MRPTLATVISARPWEERLAREATESGLVRLIARCYQRRDVPSVDAIVVGTETPWLDRAVVASWKAGGISVIGVYPQPDRAAVDWLCKAQVDQLFPDMVPAVVVLRAVRDLVSQPELNAR